LIAVDTDVLVYAHRREPVEHKDAFALLRELAEGGQPWAIPWPCVFVAGQGDEARKAL
jgi:predicted nucleic acid-binding protein